MTTPDTEAARVAEGPDTKRGARQWVRAHWADLISHADMGGVADLANDHLDAVWSDECRRIAHLLTKDQQNG